MSGAHGAGDPAEPAVEVRPATRVDVEFIFAMIVELAEYERAPDSVTGTAEMLGEALFGPRPSAEALIAERAGERIGYAVFHQTFSTWDCLPGIWLEDLYVSPECRRAGAGEILLRAVAGIAVGRGHSRCGWVALDWNEPALSFYRKHGAELCDAWLVHRVSGAALTRLAAGG